MTDEPMTRAGLFSLTIPEGWSTEEFEGADAVLVAPVVEGDFRANVVLTSVESAAPVEEALRVAVEAAWRQHPGAQVVATDVWPGDPEGRRLIFTYPVGEADQLEVEKWVWATGARHVHLSATWTPPQRAVVDPIVKRLAATVAIVHDSEGDASAPTPSRPEPDFRGRQHMKVDGPKIPRSALELLATATRSGRVAMSALRSADGAALVEAGLIGRFGGLTTQGQDVCAHWARPTAAVLGIDRSDGEAAGSLSAWFAAGSVLLAAPHPVGTEPLADGHVVVWTTSASRLVAAVTAWMGLAPAPAYADEDDIVFTTGTVERRLGNAATPPPPGSGAHLVGAWERGWTAYDIRTSQGLLPLIALDDGRWWRRRSVPDGEQLVPMPAAAVFEAVHAVVLDALLSPAG
ncbi:hypothetical protein [Microbacterium enclense]|uniref:Uncharacterized protein n=1 Tax=Microbacterium enclense TaxID=993073 RepID=A0A1G6Q500_9MICO|nr:hypothetical protein [Microbacterium enclense]KSU52188.1 hypothetical protein AS029_14430 [Microbacterium enclense]SDC87552.1 hypothetical protein SAMN05216418_3171 [Microbacterium enclense]